MSEVIQKAAIFYRKIKKYDNSSSENTDFGLPGFSDWWSKFIYCENPTKITKFLVADKWEEKYKQRILLNVLEQVKL